MPHEVMVQLDGAADQSQAAEIVRQALDRHGCSARIETVYRVATTVDRPQTPLAALTATAPLCRLCEPGELRAAGYPNL